MLAAPGPSGHPLRHRSRSGLGTPCPMGWASSPQWKQLSEDPCVPKRPFGTGTLAGGSGSHRTRRPWTSSAVGLGAPPALGPGVTTAPPPTSTLSLFTSLGDPFGRVFHTHPAMRCPGAQLTAVFLHSPNHASCWPSCPRHPPASQSLVCSE